MWSQLYETRLTWSTASIVRLLSILSTAVWQAFKYFTSWESTDFLNVFNFACWQLDSPLKTNLVSCKPSLSTAAQRGVAWWCGLSVNWPECRKRAELKERGTTNVLTLPFYKLPLTPGWNWFGPQIPHPEARLVYMDRKKHDPVGN